MTRRLLDELSRARVLTSLAFYMWSISERVSLKGPAELSPQREGGRKGREQMVETLEADGGERQALLDRAGP